MSAIFGIINKNGKPVEQQSINKMKLAIAHRATDGEGLKQIDNVAFGFCKLIIHPQQQNEQLPLETGDLVFTADARIDNRDELYSLLGLDKQQWQHEADSYLILKAYQHWGHQCPQYLQGEFVFAAWDKVKQELFLASDQIGFRPVFYYNGPEQFIFCSEIKGIAKAKSTPNYFNDEHIVNYHFKQGDPELTYNKEIFSLGGGNTLTLKGNTIEKKKYWELKPTGRYNFKRDEEWIDCMRHLMYQAVEKRLNPEVPIGVTLSGGLDSSSIACILADLLAKKNKPLYSFSSVLPVGHGGIEEDERVYIDVVNKRCPNMIQTFVEAPGTGPFDNVGKAFEIDESIPNGFFYMDMALDEAAKEKGVRSLYTGFGGDFWVSWKGASVIYMLMRQGKYKTAVQMINQISKINGTHPLKLIKSNYLFYTGWWQQLRKLKPRDTNWQKHTALKPEFLNNFTGVLHRKTETDQTAAMHKMICEGSLGRLSGMFNNRNGYYGMESCDPMFDKDIMEFLTELPLHLFKLNGHHRSLIRHAMEGILPAGIQWRKDKSPYSPDFARRTIANKEKLFNMMADPKNAYVFDKYITKDVITRHFDSIAPFKGFSSPTSVVGIRLTQAGIVTKVLNYLKHEGYLFE